MKAAAIWMALGWALVLTSTDVRADAPDWANGDVLIGTAATGAELDTEAPERPLLVVIDTPYQVFDEAGTFIHVAAWTSDGTAARGARVYLAGHLVGRTDERGALVFRWGVPGNDVASYWTNGSDISVRWDHSGATYGGQVWFSAFSRTSSFASDHLFVYTDRGVYNPGQSIRIRTIGWHLAADYEALEEAQVEFLLSDPDGQPVAGGRAETDRFGTAAIDLPVPGRADEGVYELLATYEGARATARLRIERFEPPVIEIEHTLGRFLTRDQDELAFDVTLGYFTGGEFHSGTLTADLLVEGSSRFHLEREVTGAGPHAFVIGGDDLDDIRDDLYEDQRIEVQLTVTDDQGRSDDLTRELRYTANPYIAIIEKDRDAYSTGDAIELVVRITDRERVPLRDTEIRLEGSCGDEHTTVTDSGGTAQFSLSMPDTECNVEVYISGVDTALATAWVPWQPRQPMRSHIGDAIVEENEPVHVSVAFPADFEPAESVVHMDVVDTSGSLVNSVLIPIRHDGATYAAEGTFTAPSWGSMLLTFFCLGRQEGVEGRTGPDETALGLMTEGQNLAVHPGRELTITLDGVPDELAPGADLSGTIRVTDSQGNPVDAAVGAAVVDRAVISLKDPLEITPMDHFYNPELRVISTTGSAILTWPVVSRNWGSRVMDVALPPFPWLEGGAIYTSGSYAGGFGLGAGGAGYGAFGEGDSFADELQVSGELYAAEAEPMAPPPAQPMMMMMESASIPEEEMADDRERGRGREHAEGPETAPVITIRTEFPETALWEPHLVAEGGTAALSASLPDAITEQQVTLVASDRRGGVGVLRHTVRVTQPLFVQADLPDALTVGDRVSIPVAVQNLTDTPQQVTLTAGATFAVENPYPEPLEVGAHATRVVLLQAHPETAGEHTIEVSARTAERQDVERQTIWVRPAGTPEVTEMNGTVSAASPFEERVDIPAGGQLTTVTLNVAFPAIGSAFAGLDAIRSKLGGGGVMSLGGELIATTLLYDYQRRAGRSAEELEQMRQMLNGALFDVLAAQRPDGGWGFWWDSESSPYVSAYCLEALLTLRETDFAVPQPRIRGAIQYLVGSWSGQPWDQSAIAFWEGNTDTVRLGLSAEIFSILASVPADLRTPAWTSTVTAMAGRFREALEADNPDILTTAYALLGLHRLTGVIEIDRERLSAAARRLGTLRTEAHWEPSWFNAYGGTIEATVAVLEVYRALGQELPPADMRETVRYLLSTRDEWGGWHNPRGTAAAIRGLLILQPAEPEVASTVVVSVDGNEVGRVAVDPADPFLSAIALRRFDLTPFVSAGRHTVAVRYDGRLDPSVRVLTHHWGEADREPGLVRVETTLEAGSTEVGQPITYDLTLTSESGNQLLVELEIPAPPNATIERASIQSLRDRGLVESVSWNGPGVRLVAQLPAHGSRRLDLRLVGSRPGEAAVPSPRVTVFGGPGAPARGATGSNAEARLIVE